MITKELLQEALDQDTLKQGSAILAKIPKGERHSHLLLSAPLDLYKKLSSNSFFVPDKFKNYQEFKSLIKEKFIPLFKLFDYQRLIIASAIERFLSDENRQVITSLDLFAAKAATLSWDEYAKEIGAVLNDFRGRLDIKIDLGLDREYLNSHDFSSEAIEEALSCGLFSGIDIYGDESQPLSKAHYQLISYHKKQNLPIKIHLGERDLEYKKFESELIEILDYVDEVQHGMHLIKHLQLLKMIKERDILLNLSPASNIALSSFQEYSQFNIRGLLNFGIKVTIASDDFAIFNRSISQQYLELYKAQIVSADELEVLRKSSLIR
jgi:adenosine deaminase